LVSGLTGLVVRKSGGSSIKVISFALLLDVLISAKQGLVTLLLQTSPLAAVCDQGLNPKHYFGSSGQIRLLG
jgi:hypothetical protein